jgi:predicted DNA-binding protein
MTRKERAASLESADGRARVLRTTIFLTDVLDHNLDLLALETGRPKGDLIRDGISKILVEYNYRPNQKAVFTVEKDGQPASAV